jgi:hypothetical protein
MRVGDHLEDIRADRTIILKSVFKEWVWMARAGLVWLRKGTSGAPVWMHY